jgi:hypothetical protein
MDQCVECGVTIRQGQRSYYLGKLEYGSYVVCAACYIRLGSPREKVRPKYPDRPKRRPHKPKQLRPELVSRIGGSITAAHEPVGPTCDICGKIIGPGRLTLDIQKEEGGSAIACSDCYARLEQATVVVEEDEKAVTPARLGAAEIVGVTLATVIALVVGSVFPVGWGVEFELAVRSGVYALILVGAIAWGVGTVVGFAMRMMTARHTGESLRHASIAVMALALILAEFILAWSSAVVSREQYRISLQEPDLSTILTLVILLPLSRLWETPGVILFWGIATVSAHVTVGARMMAPVLLRDTKKITSSGLSKPLITIAVIFGIVAWLTLFLGFAYINRSPGFQNAVVEVTCDQLQRSEGAAIERKAKIEMSGWLRISLCDNQPRDYGWASLTMSDPTVLREASEATGRAPESRMGAEMPT